MARGVFSADWSPKQELRLLEGLEEFGYGNCYHKCRSCVSLKTGKTPSDCKSHYDHYYMYHRHHNLPEFPFHLIKREADQGKPRPPWEPWEESGEVYYPGTEIDGYMPRRGDFAHEAEGDAEAIIADLETDTEQDDDLTTALNLVLLQIYQAKLRKRTFKKRIVKDYGLLDLHKQNAIDASRLTRQQQRLKRITRPFLRFMSPTNAAKFMQSHFLEEQLCSKIRKLQHYRENGIRTMKGVTLYERLHSERKHQKAREKSLIKKNYSAEETLLSQVLNQGSLLKHKKQATSKGPKSLDITYSIGVEKLDQQEKEVCSQCRIQPEAYLQFKRQMVWEYKKLGRLTLAESRKLLKIDVNKTRKVYDLLIAKGLINLGPTITTTE